jgi:hypothetical protein
MLLVVLVRGITMPITEEDFNKGVEQTILRAPERCNIHPNHSTRKDGTCSHAYLCGNHGGSECPAK